MHILEYFFGFLRVFDFLFFKILCLSLLVAVVGTSKSDGSTENFFWKYSSILFCISGFISLSSFKNISQKTEIEILSQSQLRCNAPSVLK